MLFRSVSRGTGVEMPTLMQLAAEIASNNASHEAMALVLATVVGINGVVLSPFSTVGALACGCAPKDLDVDKLYRSLILTAIIFILGSSMLAYLGFFRLFA